MQAMLDTDTSSYIMRGNKAVLARLATVPVEGVCISTITYAELLFGVEVSPRKDKDALALRAYLPIVMILPFPEEAAGHYAEIRATLKRSGMPIGANDLFLAAHARSLGLTLVTNNVREFTRVPGLKLENWT